VQLDALTSIRFFAALHILVFHVYEGHRMSQGEAPGSLKVFDQLPAFVLNWLRHGYFSTSLFFLISGFILAFLYIRPDGQMSIAKRTFWIARMSRVYPLHILIIGIAAPIAIIAAIIVDELSLFTVVSSGLLSAALLQAWVPPYALSWNFPTWALSTVAFFYLMFPLLTRLLRNRSRRQLAIGLAVLPLVSLLPSFVFLACYPDGGKPLSFWHEFVMRTPLFWIPHFLMGMTLSRLAEISRFDLSWQGSSRSVFSWGDLSFLGVLGVSLVDVPIPNFVLRHGLLAPFYLVTIYDLARNRGMLARLLCLPGIRILGDASFAMFMLQLPVFILIMIVATVIPMPSALHVSLIVIVAVGVSLLSTRYFEKPVSRRLRARFEPDYS
jgi:peptidoglycan/LPS O-acetylase OafA/YrhL